MTHNKTHVIVVALLLAVLNAPLPSHVQAYTFVGAKWGTDFVPFYVNPRNVHVSDAVAISAFQAAADVWTTQAGANIELAYAGYTSGTSVGMNNKNEVFFRESNGSYAGEAFYWWDSSGRMVDSDVVFYQGTYKFFVGSGCSSGLYLESVATHEFGHLLGLRHSEVSGATMYATGPYCGRDQLTLEEDDIAGMRTLYPPAGAAQPPAAPSNAAAGQNASSPTSSLVVSWRDNASDESGYRVERSRDGVSYLQVSQLGANAASYTDSGLSAGSAYYYRVYAFNGNGSSAYSNVAAGQTSSAAPAATSPAGPMLTASPYKQKGLQKVDLKWSGLTASSVAVYRNGSVVATVGNNGSWTDSIDRKGGGTYTYKLCASGTSTCSNEATARF